MSAACRPALNGVKARVNIRQKIVVQFLGLFGVARVVIKMQLERN